MLGDITIVVGCDNAITLPIILNGLRDIGRHDYISVSRVSDVTNITKTVSPTLIILNFKNNQLAINYVCAYLKDTKIPILCLTNKNENESFYWDKNYSVFTLPIESAIIKNYLSSSVNSILLLVRRLSLGSISRSIAQTPNHFNSVNRDKNLSRYILELDQKVETLIRIKDSLKQLYPEVDDPIRIKLISMVNWIKASTGDKKHWDDFRMYFENINPEYVKKLSEKHPSLTIKDIKYCCYLKMNMSNDDIRHIFGINTESVRMHKYRLKKKMALSRDQDLHNYTKSLILNAT